LLFWPDKRVVGSPNSEARTSSSEALLNDRSGAILRVGTVSGLSRPGNNIFGCK